MLSCREFEASIYCVGFFGERTSSFSEEKEMLVGREGGGMDGWMEGEGLRWIRFKALLGLPSASVY